MSDFVVARNPDPESSLPFLLLLPVEGEPIWLKAREDWPRSTRVYCHPLEKVPPQDTLEIVSRVHSTVCRRRGTAIDLILDRGLNRRSQFIFTISRGRPIILWQTPKTAKTAKPGLRIPTGRSERTPQLYIDSRERYGYSFAGHRVVTERRPLSVGDYASMVDARIIGVVERKTIEDFATSLVDGSLSFAMAELAALPAAAIVVEGTYSGVLRYTYTQPGRMPALIARLLIRYPNVSVNFLESRKVAEEWTYRFLIAAYADESMLDV